MKKKSQFEEHEMLPAGPVQQESTEVIESKMDKLGLRMKWEEGDFMINDNLGFERATNNIERIFTYNGLFFWMEFTSQNFAVR